MDILTKPKHKLTLGAVNEYECEILRDARVTRRENGFDIATIVIDNESMIYPYIVTAETAVQLEVTNEGASYPTNPMFKGVCRFPIANIDKDKNAVALSCLGAGYGHGEMLVAQEYGAQSANPALDTISEILTDATHGIIPRYVNRILEAGAAGDSGFNYDVTDVDAINDVIRYIEFPYKPADKSINDLIDLISALKAGSAGAHWIVTTDDHFRLKLLTSSQAGEWDKYYGASQANATLVYGEDYEDYNLEVQKAEGNYIIYYGLWRRPGNGDAWTNSTTDGWGFEDITLSVNTDHKIVGTGSLKLQEDTHDASNEIHYPSGKNAGWDFTLFDSQRYVPTINFYVEKHQDVESLIFRLCTSDAAYIQTINFGTSGTYIKTNDKFYHFSIPIGEYWDTVTRESIGWNEIVGAFDWNNINFLQFLYYDAIGDCIYIDGLHFGNVPLCRVAWNGNLPGNTAKMRLIVDDIGKDDSLIATDDSGTMAQLAYAELLRQQKETLNLQVKTNMLHEALPGQWFYVNSIDMRATQLIQEIHGDDYTTTLNLTDDVTNGRARLRYEDLNKQYANLRPEFQDRQATNIKAGSIDWRISRLVKNYA